MSLRGKLLQMGINLDAEGNITTEDSTVTDDLSVTDDASIGGNLTVTGTINGGVFTNSDDTMSPAAPITAAAASYSSSVVRTGNLVHTLIRIDLTGLQSSTTLNDVLGDTGASHIGQITTTVNGVIFDGDIHCTEVPTGGVPDIDLYASSAADGAFDADASGLADAVQLVDAAASLAIGTTHNFTAIPAADSYLYLASGTAGTAATYTAGIIVIELRGWAGI